MRTFLMACTVMLMLAPEVLMPMGVSAQQASVRQQTIRGVIKAGSLDSSVDVTEEESYGFLTDSPVGNKIFADCKMDELCEIEATVDIVQKWIKSVRRVANVSNSAPVASLGSSRARQEVVSDACSDQNVVQLTTDAVLKQLKHEQALSVMRTGFINPNQGEPRVVLQAIRTSTDRNGQKICNARAVISIPFKDSRPPFTFSGDITYRAQITDAGDEVIVTLLKY